MDLKEALNIKTALSKDLLSPKIGGRKMLKENYSKFANFGNIDNVIGVGIGSKSNSNIINIYIEKEEVFNNNVICENYNVGRQDEIAIITIGKVDLFPKRNHRPAFPGCSIGHTQVTAGTIGCVVYNENGTYILSNNHVLANLNNAVKGDHILQPGPHDGGLIGYNTIGYLEDFEAIDLINDNEMDAAIALIERADVNPIIPYVGIIRGQEPPQINMRVEKYGRTTEHTIGVIKDIGADVLVNCNGTVVKFIDQIRITSSIPAHLFSTGGDSGSLIVNQGNKHAVALLFAGNDITNTTFATPIIKILNRFNVQILSV